MKILNKIISALCIVALLISAVPAYAGVSPTLYFTNPTLTAGGSSAYCYLKMDNAENISAMDYRILYDAENIELDSMYKTGFTNQSDVTVSANTSEPGVIHVTLISQNGLNGNNYVHLMYFKAKKDAKPGTYPISVLVTDIYNSSLDTVVATTQKGTITVKEATQAVKNISFSSLVSPSSLKVGETVNYKLSASSLNNLSAGTFDFTYDETKLKFNGATLSSAMQNTVCDINDSIDGLVKISFASEKAITSGSNLVTLEFSSIAPGTASIAFKPSDLYDSSFVGMTGNELTKSVSIAEPEIVIDYPDFKFLIPEAAPSDKEFTVKAVLEGGSGVRAGDFVVNYNSNILECTGVNSETVSGAWVVTDKNYSNGQIRFSLMSNVDLTEDTALVAMKLKARENVDSKSKLTATGTGINDVKFNVVTLEFVDSEVEVVRPEYTVNFYDSDGTTLLATQNVMSGNSAIPPKTEQIRKSDGNNHLKFSGWGKDYSVIIDNTDIVAVYVDEAHTVITQSAVEATCTESGLTEGKYCVVCSEILAKQEVIPEKGHNEVTDESVAPNCTETGLTEGSHCSVCDEVIVAQQVVPANGHIEVILPRVEPTCTEPGLTEGKCCSVCNETLVSQTEIKANEHTTVVDKAVAPTCTDTGLTEGRHCSVCKEVLVAQKVVPANGHTEVILPRVEPTCTEPGLTEGKYCSVCNETLVSQTEIKANGHTAVATPDIKPEVSTPGYTGGTHCDVCGEVLTQPEFVPATGIWAKAILSEMGTLTVSGALADDAVAEGTTFIGIYNSTGRLIKTVDITELNQSEFEINIPNCKGVSYIKIMRWDMSALKPLCDAIKVEIEMHQYVNAILVGGTLTVSGALADDAATEGATFIGIYNSTGQLIKTVDITELNQSEFEINIPNCKGVSYIKIMRWDMSALKPLCDAIKVEVEMHQYINAILTDGTLTVSGALADDAVTEGTTFLSVYDEDNRMLITKDITAFDLSEFAVSIKNQEDAHTVKVLSWEMPGLRPLHNAMAVNVEK